MIFFYVGALIADTALGMVLLCVPIFAIKTFGASALYLGILGSLSSIVYTVAVIFFGRLADKINRKSILIAGCSVFFLTYLAFPFVKSLNQILIIYPIGSFGMAMFWPSIQSWLAENIKKKDLHKTISNFNISWSLGLMSGSFLGGVLFEMDSRIPFFVAAAFILSLIILLWNIPCKKQAIANSFEKIPDSVDRAIASKFIYIALIANFVSWSIIGTVRNIFPKLALFLKFSPGEIGALMFALSAAQTAMFFILGKTNKWHYRLGFLLFFQGIAAIYLVAFLFVSITPLFFIIFLFIGLSSGMTYFSSIYYSLYNEEDRGRRSGIHEGFLGAGALFGPFFSGIISQIFGLRAPYLMLSFLTLAVIFLEIWIARRRI